MSQKLNAAIAVIGIDIGKNSFHIVGHDHRGAIVLRQKWSRGQVETRFANLPPCLIGMEACVGAHHLSRKLQMLGHDARLMPAKYVRPYSKGQKNDFRDAEAIAEAVQRPTMKFVATKTADQLDLQALHRVRDRVLERPRLRGLAWTGAEADIDRRPHDPRQYIKARQSLPARAVRASRVGCAGKGKVLGALWPQILDRSRQETIAPQRAGDCARQQARPDRLGGSQQGTRLRVRQDGADGVPACLILAPCSGRQGAAWQR